MIASSLIAQAPAPALPPASGPSAATIFYVTLLIIFLSAIIGAVAAKWSRDKCLKLLDAYHVTLERSRGQTLGGQLKVFSAGIEVVYDHPFIDPRGRKKTSYLIYGQEIDQHMLALLRYHGEMSDAQQKQRDQQIRRTFNPGPLRRLWRGVRNLVNTLRDAFNATIGAVVTQYQRVNPASAAILSSQGNSVAQIGQTLLGRFANAYEPLLEQYIGQAVILDVADPINPNNATAEYTGYLAEYTQQFIAVFNVKHQCSDAFAVRLPDVTEGAPLPPLPMPPPPGAPAPTLPPPERVDHDIAIRIDGLRLKIQNTSHEPVVLRRLEREGFEPVALGVVVAPSAAFDIPARDARGGNLICEPIRMLDIVAPRRFATIRHAGELVERRSFIDELHLAQLPLVPKLLNSFHASGSEPDDEQAAASSD